LQLSLRRGANARLRPPQQAQKGHALSCLTPLYDYSRSNPKPPLHSSAFCSSSACSRLASSRSIQSGLYGRDSSHPIGFSAGAVSNKATARRRSPSLTVPSFMLLRATPRLSRLCETCWMSALRIPLIQWPASSQDFREASAAPKVL